MPVLIRPFLIRLFPDPSLIRLVVCCSPGSVYMGN